MRGVLGLAADFIDRMTNPVHGQEENAAYAARFAELLERDEGLESQLIVGDLGANDVDLLGLQGWLWYLNWLAARGVLPGEAFLTALYQDADDSLLRLLLVEAVATNPAMAGPYRDRSPGEPVALTQLPPSWLRDRLLGLVDPERGAHGQPRPDPEGALAEAAELATALLQVGNVAALTLLRALLGHPWPQQAALVQLVDDTLRASGMDAETLAEWRHLLGIG